MPAAEVQKVALEIAVLGSSGLDLNDSTQKYRLRSLSGSFSGLHLVSIMYIAFKQVAPGRDVGFNLSREYKEALPMHRR